MGLSSGNFWLAQHDLIYRILISTLYRKSVSFESTEQSTIIAQLSGRKRVKFRNLLIEY